MDEQSTELTNTLLAESDRGLILAGSAFLDNALEELLKATLRKDLANKDHKQLFTHFGPFSTMSSRTLVAYAMELIDEGTRKSLDQLRSIRNHFAHHAGVTPLPEEAIAKLLELVDPSIKLGVIAFGRAEDPKFSDQRVKATLCIVSIWAKIRQRTRATEK